MRRSSPAVLAGVAVLGVVTGFALDQVLTATGQSTFTPIVQLPILLIGLGVVCFAVALPVRRSRRPGAARVDPFRALRAAVFAKASSLVGAAMSGFSVGLLVFLLSRPVAAPVGSILVIGFTALSAVLLVAAALVAESFCTLPKDDDDEHPGADAGPQPHAH